MATSSTKPGQSAPSPPEAASPAGAEAALDPARWVEQHGDYLFGYALLRVRDRAVAEDLVQDTLLAALRGRDRFDPSASERGWLTGILRHKITDHFRRRARETPLAEATSLPAELEERFDDLGLWRREPESGPADWGADAATLVERREFMAALRQCLDKLPPRCADAFVLREMEDTPSAEIQTALDLTPANFWVLLHRARLQLRLCLERNWLNL